MSYTFEHARKIILEMSEANEKQAFTDQNDFHVLKTQQMERYEENLVYEMMGYMDMGNDIVKIQI